MQFVTVRDLRNMSARIWRMLPVEKEIVLTLNGKPIGIISAVSGGNLEESLAMMRRVRAMAAVNHLQLKAGKTGLDRLSPAEIDKEITAVRKNRRPR